MRFLDLIRPGRFDDPIIGALRRRWWRWHGTIALGAGETVPLTLAGGLSRPELGRVALATYLSTNYGALRPEIEQKLFEHYAPYAEAVAAGEEPSAPHLPRIERPADVWPHVIPVRVTIEPSGGVETVEIAYRVAWDEEHTLGAHFQDRRLVELNGSVRA